MSADPKSDMDLPGFRFHPTEDELLEFYLKKIISGNSLPYFAINFVNIYLHDPWHLPDLAKIGEREWYFFVPRDRKQGTGGRPNRTTANGFWKATGSDRRIISTSEPKRVIGLRKTLVFYRGRAPRGCKTDWVMNEYRLPDPHNHRSASSSQEIVLCKVYRKATSLKVLEQRAAMDQDDEARGVTPPPHFLLLPRTPSNDSLSADFEQMLESMKDGDEEGAVGIAAEGRSFGVSSSSEFMSSSSSSSTSSSGLKFPVGMDVMADLQVPKLDADWTQDQFWTQFNSPWLMNLTPSYINLLNL
uniref:NAC domain-containing protein n=1 Tax=Kalanchoe fedtschenkoi TaxID=63787 RepID=A0A7N0U623_KALFE